jgi:hypothetical protein
VALENSKSECDANDNLAVSSEIEDIFKIMLSEILALVPQRVCLDLILILASPLVIGSGCFAPIISYGLLWLSEWPDCGQLHIPALAI